MKAQTLALKEISSGTYSRIQSAIYQISHSKPEVFFRSRIPRESPLPICHSPRGKPSQFKGCTAIRLQKDPTWQLVDVTKTRNELWQLGRVRKGVNSQPLTYL
jgi:hypothetical protein